MGTPSSRVSVGNRAVRTLCFLSRQFWAAVTVWVVALTVYFAVSAASTDGIVMAVCFGVPVACTTFTLCVAAINGG